MNIVDRPASMRAVQRSLVRAGLISMAAASCDGAVEDSRLDLAAVNNDAQEVVGIAVGAYLGASGEYAVTVHANEDALLFDGVAGRTTCKRLVADDPRHVVLHFGAVGVLPPTLRVRWLSSG